MRLMDRREAPPMQAGEERSDAEWLTAVSLPPLIEHERTDRQPPR
jgi:hypothetical protein